MKRLKKIVKIAFLGILMLSAACNINKRNVNRMKAYAVQYPDQFKLLANQLDPCFIGPAKSDTVVTNHTDTLVKEGTTTIVRVKDTVFVTKTLPGKVITNTRTLTVHDTLTNNRALEASQTYNKIIGDSLIIYKTKYSQVSKSLTQWKTWGIALAIAAIVLLAIKLYIAIKGGAIKSAINSIK